MGHSSQIALGIALAKPERNVICFDGDGAVIMHMGSMSIISSKKPQNYKHIILNNGAHDSVGGQPTAGFDIEFTGIAKACGYRSFFLAVNKVELVENVGIFMADKGPSLLEVRVKKGVRENLGRPTTSPLENKKEFMGRRKKIV